MPQSSWKDDGEEVDLGDIGWAAGLGFYRNITRVITLGLDGNYAQFGDGDERADKSYLRTGAATGLVALRVNFFPRQTTRLYIPAGIGVGHVFVRQNNDDGSHKTYNSTDLAGMLGLGLEFDIDESIIFGAEGRKELDTTEQLKQKPTSIATNSVESDVTWATPLSLESSFTLYVKENMIRTCSS